MDITSASIIALIEGGAFLVNTALRAQKGELSQSDVDAILAHVGVEASDLRRVIDAALEEKD
ncbi:hypothetical protein J0X12_13280 [Sneathiella sp. CAU 1612]|uniref:Uncharacterized protein n=1 Tax=Sneathiella sedimenti TaxID=2816034 RepID=A0ABS3F7U3_9PROT|nr:hypothetical protein [Sneathiella sedimenti]MBO0334595.1 hypothetical protein [Sneathiella sedimenti]